MSNEQDQQDAPLSAEEGQALWNDLEREEQGEEPQAAQPPADEPSQPASEPEHAAPAAKPAEPVDPRDIKPEYVSALERQVSELSGLVKSSIGRVGSLQSTVDKLVKAPTQAQVAAAIGSSAKWDALKKDFPDFAEAVEERVAAVAATPGVDPAAILEEAKSFAAEQVSTTHIKTAKTLANLVEPDWETVGKSNEFHAWLETQPAETFAKAVKASAEWDAATVVQLVREFKSASAPARAAPQRGSATGSRQRLASAAVPTGVTGARVVNEDALEGEALWKHLAQQEERAARRQA
jgi:hypothetical protein